MENLTGAQSFIRDLDFAAETTNFTKSQIIDFRIVGGELDPAGGTPPADRHLGPVVGRHRQPTSAGTGNGRNERLDGGAPLGPARKSFCAGPAPLTPFLFHVLNGEGKRAISRGLYWYCPVALSRESSMPAARIVMFSDGAAPANQLAKEALEEHHLSWKEQNTATDAQSNAFIRKLCGAPASPVLYVNEKWLPTPSQEELLEACGVRFDPESIKSRGQTIYDVIVIGLGPAGCRPATAAGWAGCRCSGSTRMHPADICAN